MSGKMVVSCKVVDVCGLIGDVMLLVSCCWWCCGIVTAVLAALSARVEMMAFPTWSAVATEQRAWKSQRFDCWAVC